MTDIQKTEEALSPSDKLAILYEDNHIIVVLKPQNLASCPDESGDENLLDLVREYIRTAYNKPGNVYVGLVHRLDRPTGGVMVFAKTSKAAARLSESMREGLFEKTYLCVTCGVPKEKKGELVHYLKKNERTNTVSVVPMLTEGAKKAELFYEVLEECQGFALVKVKLGTGRSHQIRVQMATLKCPLFGDRRYGGDPKTFKHGLALWATRISFPHPTEEKRMTFLVYPPADEVPWSAFDINYHLAKI